ncbi:hypothetical protein [Coleofasciculus sp. FACHB-T130]|uniref:hypothetical protein n=1 Tax=Cyanophyceae TaxID=3028117 RepID=UPI0016832DA9|nr:hypothetical protein [Coleofasciculus sp. FACHB-T130]MBD1881137.1 hypothetical protein [Coleofasciculus sp. FACHB-T130]
MPKTKLHKESSVSTDELMDDLTIPDSLRKDLGYPAQKKKEALRTEHLEKKLLERLQTINTNLKADGVKVQLVRVGNTIALQFSAPLRDGDKPTVAGRSSKQYKLGANCPWSADGLTLADSYARQIGHHLLHKTFTWQWFDSEIAKKSESITTETPKTIGELIEEFKVKYFHTKKRGRQSEATLKKWLEQLQALPTDKPLSSELIMQAVQSTKAESSKRVNLVKALSVFCNIISFKFEFKGLKNGYKPKEKTIPTDEKIEQYRLTFQPSKYRPNFQWEEYQWLYGILATYGLRIHEVWAIDIPKFLDPANTDNVITLDESLTEGLKTGERVVFPLHPEWVEKFNLKDVKMPQFSSNLEDKSTAVCRRFKDRKIPFTPHTLRHAYAIRGHVLGIPIKEMANNMGHSVQMHTDTYQKYMSLDTRTQVMRQAHERNKGQQKELSEVERLKAENEALRAEIESLKTELRLTRELAGK